MVESKTGRPLAEILTPALMLHFNLAAVQVHATLREEDFP
jgi:hypothetical protein